MTPIRAFEWCAALLLVLLACSASGAQEPGPAAPEPYGDDRLRRYRLQLDWHPIGLVVPHGELRFSSFIRMHPAGFRATDYDLLLAPTYGLGSGWEVTAGLTTAERIGRGGNAVFYGAGLQKQIIRETKRRPALSLGGYGMTGPHDHHSGSLYLAGTKEIWARGDRALFLHGGAKYEAFDSNDYGRSTGIRPYAGATLALSRRAFLSGDFSPAQPWEGSNMYALRASYRVYKRIGVSAGIQNNGYETGPIFGLTF